MSHDTDALTPMQKTVVGMLRRHMDIILADCYMSDLHENAQRVQELLQSNPHAIEEVVRALEGVRFVGVDKNGNSADPVKTLIDVYTDTRAFGTSN